MTKIFDVIPVDDYAVVVDKSIKEADGLCYLNGIFTNCNVAIKLMDGEYKIVASINKKIDDSIPVIKLFDEYVDKSDELNKLAEEFAIKWWYPDSIGRGIKDTITGEYFDEIDETMRIFKEGYAAHSKYKWSDEQVWKLLCQIAEQGLSTTPHSRSWPWSKKNEIQTIMDSLKKNKFPKQVELEMEKRDVYTCRADKCWCDPFNKFCHFVKHSTETGIKITDPQTNTIIPVNIIM